VIEIGSEFQTDGTEDRKARFANSVLTKGLISGGTSDEHSVHANCCNLMCRLRCVGTVMLWILHVRDWNSFQSF